LQRVARSVGLRNAIAQRHVQLQPTLIDRRES